MAKIQKAGYVANKDPDKKTCFESRESNLHEKGLLPVISQVSVGSYDLFTGTIDGVNNMLVKNLECCFLRQIY